MLKKILYKPVKLIRLLSILFLFFIGMSCGKKYECDKENLMPVFVSYTDPEIDSIVIRRFKTGTAFTQQIDSVLLTPSTAFFNRRADTVEVFLQQPDLRLTGSYDYQLLNLFDHKLVTVSEMVFKITESKSGGLFSMDPSSCQSPLVSYKTNGSFISVHANDGNDNLYIHK